ALAKDGLGHAETLEAIVVIDERHAPYPLDPATISREAKGHLVGRTHRRTPCGRAPNWNVSALVSAFQLLPPRSGRGPMCPQAHRRPGGGRRPGIRPRTRYCDRPAENRR